MGNILCIGRTNWSCAFNSASLFRIGCGPAALLSPRLWSGAGRRVCRSVLVAVPIGLIPAVEVAYFANDAAVIALLAMGSAIAAAFVCMLLRGKRDNDSDIACASDPFDAGAFPPPCRLEKSSLFDCCSKGKRRRKLPGRRIRSHRR